MSRSEDFDINDAEEILVRFTNGNEIIYKGKGLEKLRRLMTNSPAYGEQKNRRFVTTIVEDEYSDPEDVPVSNKPMRTKSGKPKKGPSIGPGGYHTADLDYSPSSANKTKSPMDIARDMQRQAEQASGIKF
jgi:hypothetical protein